MGKPVANIEFICNEMNVWSVEAHVWDKRFVAHGVEFGAINDCHPDVIANMLKTAPLKLTLRDHELVFEWGIRDLGVHIVVPVQEEYLIEEFGQFVRQKIDKLNRRRQ